jgi:PAS domain S-box-containing protein
VMSWNSGAERILGYEPSESLGKHCACFYPAPAQQTNQASVDLEEALKKETQEVEGWRVRKDGSIFWANVAITSLRDETGYLRGFVQVTRDATERKKTDDSLRQQADELRRSNAELAQFAWIASHDLKEPLRMITSYVQLLEKRFHSFLEPEVQDYMHFVVEGTSRMYHLIDDLITYSSLKRGLPSPIPIDFSYLMMRVHRYFRKTLQSRRAELTWGTLPTLKVESNQIFQLLVQLIENALKFNESEIPRVHVSAKMVNREWVFDVKDNGIGIDNAYQDKIFIIFQRLHTQEKFRGTGVGLAICKKIVEQQGGRIWFESCKGKGTLFKFTLPVDYPDR